MSAGSQKNPEPSNVETAAVAIPLSRPLLLRIYTVTPDYSWLPHGGSRLPRTNPKRQRGRTVTTPSLTLFEVAQFSAAKRRRSLAVGESPRFCNAPDLKAPEGRRQNRASPLRGFRVALQRFRGVSPCYLYTTFANSRGPRHEICAREIGSFCLPLFQERQDVRGNRGRVARD